MDYEKAYKEALERAKSKLHYPDKPCFVDVTEIFPELVESEDERIRKEILYVIHQLDDNTTICGRNYDYQKWIAWLEKQGESYTKKDVDDAWLKGICDAKRELEKQGETSPIHSNSSNIGKDKQNSAWIEEDEKFVVDTINVLYRAKNQYSQTARLEECIDWLKSLKERLKGE